MTKILIDTNIFDELIKLNSSRLKVLLNKYILLTTNINAKELERIPDIIKKDKCISFLSQYVKIISGNIFSFTSYNESIIEDSAAGFSTYNDPKEGAMLTYDDIITVTNVGVEKNKLNKGTSLNDCAFAIQCNRNKDCMPTTNDEKLKRKMKKNMPSIISWKQLLETL